MPARKIPRNYRHVTGIFKSILKNNCGVAYESPLERDFFLLTEFDDAVEGYEEQAVEVPHKNGKRNAPFYPDCLITYKPETGRRKLLVDVKHSDNIEEDKENFERRKAVVTKFAEDQGWDYAVVTEKEIRGEYLNNLKFLYKNARPPRNLDDFTQLIFDKGIAGRPLTVNEVLAMLTSDRRRQLEILPVIWHMVCLKKIGADLTKPLNMNSILEIPSS